MQDAELYKTSNSLQRRDVKELLDMAFSNSMLRFAPTQRILDLGCGPGDTTEFILLPYLPPDSQVVGADLSAELIENAKITHRSQTRIKFLQYNLECPDISVTRTLGKFDKIFSFFALHWCQNQRLALQNVYELLKPEGEILLLMIGTSPIGTLYEKMAKNPRWSKYMLDVEKHISPSQRMSGPCACAMVKHLAETVGFKDVQCTLQNKSFDYPSVSEISKLIQSLEPFSKRIPTDLKESFLSDYITESLNGLFKPLAHGKGYTMEYTTITMYAMKD